MEDVIPEMFEQRSQLYKNTYRYQGGHETGNCRILTICDDESPPQNCKDCGYDIEDNGT